MKFGHILGICLIMPVFI